MKYEASINILKGLGRAAASVCLCSGVRDVSGPSVFQTVDFYEENNKMLPNNVKI